MAEFNAVSLISGSDHPASGYEALSETEFIRRSHPAVTGRVLVMDDDQALLAFISEYLATIGMAVVTTVSGAEAMRCFHYARSIGQPFDLIFLDLVIPRGQGGRETLRQIRLVDTAVKVIISSGYANAPEVAQCRQFGFDGCLPKPYQGANLLQMAFEHLPGKYPEEQIVSGSN